MPLLRRHFETIGTKTLDHAEGNLEARHMDEHHARGDFWSTAGDCIYRHHVSPRNQVNAPQEKSFTIPLKYFDLLKQTQTAPECAEEYAFNDYWHADGATLSGERIGRSRFQVPGDHAKLQGLKTLPDLIQSGQKYG